MLTQTHWIHTVLLAFEPVAQTSPRDPSPRYSYMSVLVLVLLVAQKELWA